MKKTIIILSCEHASKNIPSAFKDYPIPDENNAFAQHDPYALELTETISQFLKCEYFTGNISRHLIDLNKPLNQGHCFTLALSPEEQHLLLEEYYHPYQNQIFNAIQKHIDDNTQVMHISIHTFNPEENGIAHNAAIGLLYDPHRHAEKEVIRIWNELFIKRTPYRVRLNYPRSGKSDNFASLCRKQWQEKDYLGLELECNVSLLSNKTLADELYNHINEVLYDLLEML